MLACNLPIHSRLPHPRGLGILSHPHFSFSLHDLLCNVWRQRRLHVACNLPHHFPFSLCARCFATCGGSAESSTPRSVCCFRQDAPTLEAALDWLCLHTPSDALPRKFAAGVRTGLAGQDVKLIAKFEGAPLAATGGGGLGQKGPPGGLDAGTHKLSPQQRQEQQQQQQQRVSSEEDAAQKKNKLESERASTKAWILQRMVAGGSGSDDADDADDRSDAGGGGSEVGRQRD